MLCPVWARSLVLLVTAMLMVEAGLAGCGSDESSSSPRPGQPISVRAAFYPLQWLAEQVGGAAVDVTAITDPGAEPHDLELTPNDVAGLVDADVVLYLEGFQPAVDDALAQASGVEGFDAAEAADLEGDDPHFWLDPARLAAVGHAFAVRLGAIRADQAAAFEANAARVQRTLTTLDRRFELGLAPCRDRNLVTSHDAFGYLARRYAFAPAAITGLSPEDEASPHDLGVTIDFVAEQDVATIYFEPLISAAIAETVGRETGAATAVLDPIEALADPAGGDDYLDVMRANLRNLEHGQRCR